MDSGAACLDADMMVVVMVEVVEEVTVPVVMMVDGRSGGGDCA